VKGESTRRWNHPAPYPEELSSRLIRMYSFVGDTVLDPFAGSGTTTASAIKTKRNSVSVEIVPDYVETMARRVAQLEIGMAFEIEQATAMRLERLAS
jgi:site-specific DNA-methyltransferase (adenine-specific)